MFYCFAIRIIGVIDWARLVTPRYSSSRKPVSSDMGIVYYQYCVWTNSQSDRNFYKVYNDAHNLRKLDYENLIVRLSEYERSKCHRFTLMSV